MSANRIKKLKEADAASIFADPHQEMAAANSIAVINFLETRIKVLEKQVLAQVKVRDQFKYLLTIPGIGNILATTIMLEVGDVSRFGKVGDFSSYCRCVKSERLSNDKKKGKGNSKNGNKYLAWAYVEAAQYCRRFCDRASRFYQRKMAKTNAAVATKALSNKLARASYYIMRDQVPYDPVKNFGS
jgi:transposase